MNTVLEKESFLYSFSFDIGLFNDQFCFVNLFALNAYKELLKCFFRLQKH